MGRKGDFSENTNAGGTTRNWNSASNVRSFLQGELDKIGLGVSKNALAEEMYRTARDEGMKVSLLNSKYLAVENENGRAEFSFTKSTKDGSWKLTPMLSYGDVTKGRHMGQTMYKADGEWFANKTDADWAVVKKKLGK